MATDSAITLRTDLLSDTYDGAGLESHLATAANKAAYKELINSSSNVQMLIESDEAFEGGILGSATAWGEFLKSSIAMRTLANSDHGTKKLCENGERLAGIFDADSNTYKTHWLNIPENYDRLNSRVNATDSHLRRQVFTASGTWTKPTTIHALSVFMVAGGGGGAGATNSFVSVGGAGGQTRFKNFTSAEITAITGNVSVAVAPAKAGGVAASGAQAGNSSTFDILTAVYGGTSSGDTNDVDRNLLTATWQFYDVDAAGGGGSWFQPEGGSGRSAYTTIFGTVTTATSGQNIGAGGGQGSVSPSSPNANGSAGVTYGCGGSSASHSGGGGSNNGGAGQVGIVVVYWVETP